MYIGSENERKYCILYILKNKQRRMHGICSEMDSVGNNTEM